MFSDSFRYQSQSLAAPSLSDPSLFSAYLLLISSRNRVRLETPFSAISDSEGSGKVISLGAGAVSFVSIVKASEPAVSALLSGIILGQVRARPAALTGFSNSQ